MAKLTKASAKISKRNPWIVPVLSLLFLASSISSVGDIAGLLLVIYSVYTLYWFYKTKQEINSVGENIPTFIVAFIPLVNFYWFYRYAKAYVEHFKKGDSPILWFFFITFLFPVSAYFVQKKLNSYAK